MELKLKKHIFNFDPTAAQLVVVGPTQFCAMGVKRGTWVLGVAVRVGVGFNGTGAVIIVGDDDATNGFVAAADVTEATPGLYDGYGTFFSTTNGKIYTTNDTIELSYTGAADATTGACSVIIVYAELE